jgi:hypothetical protein
VNNRFDDYELVEDLNKKQHLYSKRIELKITESDDSKSYIKIEKRASGSSFTDARNRAEKIEYQYKIENNKLILNNYFITDSALKQRNQSITITLYLNNNMHVKPDKSVAEYINSYQSSYNFNNGYDNKVYQINNNIIQCSNCSDKNSSDSEDSYSENKDTTTTFIIDKNGMKVEKKSADQDEFRGLKINSNGVVIKTN